MNRYSLATVAIVMLFGGAYLQGYRIITLEELPNSHRPASVFLTASYAQAHLSQPEDPNWLNNVK